MAQRGRPPATSRQEPADTPPVIALARGLAILRCFKPNSGELSVSEIAQLSGLPQPTAWRLCQTMIGAGFLAISPSSGKLRVGFAGLALGHAAVSATNVGDVALDEMQRLANEFRAASSMSARDHFEMLIVRRATAANPSLIINLDVGAHLPIASSSAGWAYLAATREDERQELLEKLEIVHGDAWPPLAKRIAAALAMYQDRGYVMNAGFYRPEINAIAAPIIPDDGESIFCLNVGGPSSVLPIDKLVRDVGPRLLQATEIIKAGLALTRSDSFGGRILPRKNGRD